MNIELPKGAYMVLPDEAKEKTSGGIILAEQDKEPPTTGTIKFVGEGLENKLNKRVRFRGSFSEPVEIEGVMYLYFRDLNSSIYYFIND